MTAEFRNVAVLAAFFACTAVMPAQQGGAPIYVGKGKPAPARRVTTSLNLICDLACAWDLDNGKAKGTLQPGVSEKVPVEAGQHTLAATTADGLDKTQQKVEVARDEQKPVIVELTPVRETRLAAEQAAEEKKEEAEREREALEKQQQAQQQAALEDTRQAYQLYLQQRYVESKSYSTKACNNGNLAACKLLALLYKNGLGGTQNYAQAFLLFEKSCAGSDQYPDACANLGDLYEHGDGIAQSYPQAVALYQKACAGKYWDGCWMLGNLYQGGLGVTRDYGQARVLDQQACDGGDMLGCVYLGGLYLNGTGVPRDVNQTLALYEKACNGGSTVGCTRLGALYETGRAGGQVNYEQAATFYKKACDSGGLDGCDSLGLLYQYAHGVPKNKHFAHTLFSRACDGGIQDACQNEKLPQ